MLSQPVLTAQQRRAQQRADLDALLRSAPLDLAGDPQVQRPIFSGMLASAPVPPTTTVTPGTLGDVPVVWTDLPGSVPTTLLYFHGGGYVIGDAASAVGTPATLADRSGIRSASVDFRLAPEAPFPAAFDDGLAAYRALLESIPARDIVIAGDSAGGGLALATMLAARDAELELPSAAILFSPWTDLTLSGDSVTTRAEADPTLTRLALERCATRYLGGQAAEHPYASPLLADLAGLPPLFITVGNNEVLLDDALRLANRAAHAGVAVSLEVGAGLAHVYPTFYPLLDEGSEALDSAARFIERTRLA